MVVLGRPSNGRFLPQPRCQAGQDEERINGPAVPPSELGGASEAARAPILVSRRIPSQGGTAVARPLRSFRRRHVVLLFSLLLHLPGPCGAGKRFGVPLAGAHTAGGGRRFLFFLTASRNRADVLVPKEMRGSVSHRFPSLRAIHREALLRDGNRPVASFRPKDVADDNGYSRAQCSSNTPPPQKSAVSFSYDRARVWPLQAALVSLSRGSSSGAHFPALRERGVEGALPSSSSRAKLVPSGWRLLCVASGGTASLHG